MDESCLRVEVVAVLLEAVALVALAFGALVLVVLTFGALARRVVVAEDALLLVEERGVRVDARLAAGLGVAGLVLA
jgi:hypothetical protein